MTHLHMTPMVSTLRVYDAPGGYEQRRPYLGIMTVSHLSDKVVYLHGAVGEIDRATYEAALAMLRERGVTTVQYERRGRMKILTLATASET